MKDEAGLNRRELGAGLAGTAALLAIPLSSCGDGALFPGKLGGADFSRGHRLTKGGFPPPAHTEETGILIAGGGAAGLSAAWALARSGYRDFRLLELEDEAGGNARGGRNTVSAYPLGAHYLPVPNREARGLRVLLTDLGMITGEQDGAPIYDPLQLCADLEERLFWRGKWQEGLWPMTGLTARDRADRRTFEAAMAGFSARVGSDGKPAFAVPMAYSSRDADLLALDQMSFAAWLDAQGLASPVLRAHVRYCCRDDYGTEPDQVSAWAGIHYFAARRGWAAHGAGDRELTWPEGNARLTRAMAARHRDRIDRGRIVFAARATVTGVEIDSFDVAKGETVRTRARAAILAMPQFVLARIVDGVSAKQHSYAPWVVANVTVDRHPAGRGTPLAWDNVPGNGDSLGYVVATHQSGSSGTGPTVLSWYMALSQMPPKQARAVMLSRSLGEWQAQVRDDLLIMNPELQGSIRSIDIWRWGHAMIRPVPGYISAQAFGSGSGLPAPLFHAHSDMSGLSLFEEAHYRGTAAAQAALAHLSLPFESLL